MFLESHFASVCINNDMTIVDFLHDPILSKFFYSFDYKKTRGDIPLDKITHAIKLY